MMDGVGIDRGRYVGRWEAKSMTILLLFYLLRKLEVSQAVENKPMQETEW